MDSAQGVPIPIEETSEMETNFSGNAPWEKSMQILSPPEGRKHFLPAKPESPISRQRFRGICPSSVQGSSLSLFPNDGVNLPLAWLPLSDDLGDRCVFLKQHEMMSWCLLCYLLPLLPLLPLLYQCDTFHYLPGVY